MSSLVGLVHDRLVDMFTEALSPLSVDVVDGPAIEQPERAALYVGADSDDTATVFDSSWAGQGSMRRNEAMDVPAMLFLRTGDTDMRPLRAELFAIYAAVEALFRPAADIGLQGYTLRAQIGTSGTYQQLQTDRGAQARLSFVITVQGRI